MAIVDSGTTHGFRKRLIAVAGSAAILAGGIAALTGCAASAPAAVPATVDAATPAAPAPVAAGRLADAPALSMMSSTKTWSFPATADLDSRSKPDRGSKMLKSNAFRRGKSVPVICQTTGGLAYGTIVWDLTSKGYVTDAYVHTGSSGFKSGVRRCPGSGDIMTREVTSTPMKSSNTKKPAKKPVTKTAKKPAKSGSSSKPGTKKFPIRVDLNGRARKELKAPAVKVYRSGSSVTVQCQSSGPNAYGSTIWDKTTDNLWVPDFYVVTGHSGFVAGLSKCPAAKTVTKPAKKPAKKAAKKPVTKTVKKPAKSGTKKFPIRVDLNGRARKELKAPAVKVYRSGSSVMVQCQSTGPNAYGSTIWDKTTDNLWVPDFYVVTGHTGFVAGLAKCPADKSSTPKPKPTAKPRVVAMGDSYGSGEGAGSYDSASSSNGDLCHRSKYSWQRNVELPGGLGVSSPDNPKIDYVQVSCSGSVTGDIFGNNRQYGEAPQLAALKGGANYVLLSIGGNNLGFATIVNDCARHSCLSSAASVQQLQAKIATVIDGRRTTPDGPSVRDTILRIHNAAPRARIVLAGYPELVRAQYIGAGSFSTFCVGINKNEGLQLDGLARFLRDTTVSMVQEMQKGGIDVRYADTVKAFSPNGASHGACSGYGFQWINGLVFRSIGDKSRNDERMHPNKAGQRAYAAAVQAVIG